MQFNLRTSIMLGVCLAVVAVLALAQPVEAGIVAVSSRADLSANDRVDWSALGTASQTDPTSITSTGGLGVTVQFGNPAYWSLIGGSWRSYVNPGGLIAGFPAGTAYIWGADANAHNFNDNLTLTFDQPVRGVGADIAAVIAFSSGAFSSSYIPPGLNGFVNLTALDSTGNALGGTVFDLGSYRNNGGNNGIPQFLGLLSDRANIQSVVLSVSAINGNNGEFEPIIGFIDEVGLGTPAPAVVPEPASLTLFGLGLLGFAGYSWRRRRATLPDES